MSHRNLTFRGGVQTLIAFGVAFVALLTIFAPLDEVAMNHSTWAWYTQEVLLFSLMALLAVVLVHFEEVQLGNIGLTRRHLLSATLAFGGIYTPIVSTFEKFGSASDARSFSYCDKPATLLSSEQCSPLSSVSVVKENVFDRPLAR